MHIPVLTYHAVHDERSVLSIPPALFKWQMDWLSRADYHVLPLRELVKRLQHGEAIPPRALAITFDDGFACSYDHAFPVLKRHGFPATVFLVAGYFGRTNDWSGQPAGLPTLPLLTLEQVREMDRAGIEFGSHSLNHPRLDELAPLDLEREVVASKAIIEDALGHPIALFCYPYGRYNQAVKAAVSRAYEGACTTRLDMLTRHSDPFAIERLDIYYLKNPALFKGLPSAWLPLYIGQRRKLRRAANVVLRRPWA
jgi:peptidoglycan/xylan/chitin deacetylase (PgdA/CDA1 family)